MAKKDKNSLLNIHYSRTLTPDNLSKAANYVGEHVLKGLGTLGRFLNAGFTSPTYGTTGQVSYARNTEDAKRLREYLEASEQAMGKAMTWVSPLNYGTALATGNGLNARKGEEEVASWSPAWQAVGRLGELYVGPKAVKGVKTTPRVVVNTAAKAGNKTAKKAVVTREINNVTKKGVQNLEKIQPEIRTRYGDVEIDNPELAYRLVGKGAVENFLKTGELFVPVKLTGNKLRDALNNMMGGTPMYKQGSLWYGLDPINYPELFTTSEPLAIGNKHATIVKSWIDPGKVIKKGIRTGEIDYAGKANLLGGRRVPFTEDLLNLSNVTSYKWVPGYGYRKVTQEPRTSLAFFERKPSKISEAERAGVPKGERFKNKKHYTGIGRNYRGTLFGEENIPKDVTYVEPISSGKNFGESDYAFENRKYATKQYLKELNNRSSSIFSNKGVEDIKEYISLLSDNINPNFVNTNNLLSFYIRDFRLYLNDLGYKAGDLSDTEISKLLTDLYDTLSKGLTGKLKEKIVFHSGPNFFDQFDFSHTGENTGNMGYLGPGNYFSTKPSVYGGKGNYTTQDLMGKYRYPRRLPYLITNIKSTPISTELKKSEIIPEYNSPPNDIHTNLDTKNNYIQLFIKPLIEKTKSRNMAILDDISASPHSLYTNGIQIEFMVPRNTGIKSLFPHPSLFVRDSNGNIILNRNWKDARVNYKQGGKMNVLEFLKKGSGIHIKKKNRGKYFKSINKYVNV